MPKIGYLNPKLKGENHGLHWKTYQQPLAKWNIQGSEGNAYCIFLQFNNIFSCFSISLSSMESEADESSLIDNVDGSTVRLLGPDAPIIVRHRTRASTGGASTHSLNEADLQVSLRVWFSIFNFFFTMSNTWLKPLFNLSGRNSQFIAVNIGIIINSSITPCVYGQFKNDCSYKNVIFHIFKSANNQTLFSPP